MTKRQLTRQQLHRQKKIHQERLNRALKKDKNLEKLIDERGDSLGPEEPGLLIAHFGMHLIVESQSGKLIHCHIRQNLGSLVTGDEIIWRQIDEHKGVVVARGERQNILARPDATGTLKEMAANIDLMVIVVAPEPKPHQTTIDSYLVISKLLSIPPLVLVNKCDLLDNHSYDDFVPFLEVYHRLGVPWLQMSTKMSQGVTELQQALTDKTSVLVGQSGVGKSSLINLLVPDADVQVGELSKVQKLGKHTTSASRLYHLPFGGQLIDSPGIRRFGLWHLSPEEILEGFKEFKPYFGKCKFRNCSHLNEPNCALKTAVDAGEIQAQRLANFHELMKAHGQS